ncbi:multi-copper oxidase [Mycena filopes]|nr:multi-copper oxidase [Mycena filopes]
MPDQLWDDTSDQEPLLPSTVQPLPAALDSKSKWTIGPPRHLKRLAACVALLLSIIILILLSWNPAWRHYNPDPQLTTPDTFVLDPDFDLDAAPQTRVYRWTVSSVSVPGVNGERIVVNGRYPGPIIEANVDDRIMVYVTNGLKDGNGTSIHWHGLPQPNTPFYDGPSGTTQCPIPPGATLLYNFTFGGWTGTTWWHGHTDMQHTDGLYGAIVVHGPQDRIAPPYDSDHALVMADIYIDPVDVLLGPYLTETSPAGSPEPVPDWAEINGLGAGAHNNWTYFEVDVKPDTTPRLRLINAGTFAPFRVSVDGHWLTIVEADGTPVEATRVREVVLQAAQRYSVLVHRDASAGGTDAFWIRGTMVDKNFGYNNPNIQLETRAILRYGNSSALPTTQPDAPQQLPAFDEWALRPAAALTHPPPATNSTTLLPFAFSVRQNPYWRSYINDTSWDSLPRSRGWAAGVEDVARVGAGVRGVSVWEGDQLIAAFEHGESVDFVVTNTDTGDHPFHLHGYSPWLLGMGPGFYDPATAQLNTVNPLWRDTFNVPGSSWVAVRILADNPGYWTFHCHIGWHLVTGALFQIAVPTVEGGVPLAPEVIREQCRMWL